MRKRPERQASRHDPVALRLIITAIAVAFMGGLISPHAVFSSGVAHQEERTVVTQTSPPPSLTPPARPTGPPAASRSQPKEAFSKKPPPPPPPPAPKPPPPPKPRSPQPVGGLSQIQMDNAVTIVRVGKEKGIPGRGWVVALATATQESTLLNLANPNVPGSMSLPHEGVGSDHDSVGLFQQRPSMGWGTVKQCQTPSYAAAVFYDRLVAISGWEDLPITVAAQQVQRSAFPDAYAKHVQLAYDIIDEIGW